MRLTLNAAFLGAALSVSFRALAATDPAEVPPVEPTGPDLSENSSSADVAGWRLCPSCGKLNGRETLFCISCGRDLNLGRREIAARSTPSVTLEPSLSFYRDFTELGPGFSFAADAGYVREELTAFAALDAEYRFRYEGFFFASDTHFYFTKNALRPYAAFDVSLWNYGDDVIAEFGPAAGVRYDHDGRGSFFYCGAGFGARAFPTWQEYGPDTYEWDSQFSASFRLVHYYADFAGVAFAARTFFGGAVITVGHAFTF